LRLIAAPMRSTTAAASLEWLVPVSSRSSAFSVTRTFDACFLRAVQPEVTLRLVVSFGFFFSC